MRKLIILFLSLAVVTLSSTGCKSITTNPDGTVTTNQIALDPERTALAVKGLAATGAALAISKDPNSAAYLKAVSVLARTAAVGAYDPDKLRSVIDSISVNELRTPEARAAVEAFFGIYTAYFGDVVAQRLDKNEWVKPILIALADGLDAGTGASYKLYLPAKAGVEEAKSGCDHDWTMTKSGDAACSGAYITRITCIKCKEPMPPGCLSPATRVMVP